MMRWNVHFRDDGEIFQVDNGDPVPIDGNDLIEIEMPDGAEMIHSKNFRVGLDTRTLVEHSDKEKRRRAELYAIKFDRE